MSELSAAADDIALVDLLDRVIGEGVVIGGDIVLSIAGVDLVAASVTTRPHPSTADGWSNSHDAQSS